MNRSVRTTVQLGRDRRLLRPRARTALALASVGALVVVTGCNTAPRPPEPAGVEMAPPARPTTTRDAAFPLAVSPNRRYLVDRRNDPFLIVGDSPQALFVNVSVAQANYFLANRKAAGFNTVWVNLLCAKYTGVGRMAALMTGSVRSDGRVIWRHRTRRTSRTPTR